MLPRRAPLPERKRTVPTDHARADRCSGRAQAAIQPSATSSRLLAVVGIAAVGIVWALAVPADANSAPSIRLRTVATNVASPTWVGSPPRDPRLFATEQRGRLLMWKGRTRRAVLDVRRAVGASGAEQGLLGAAFHDDFAANGRFWIYFTNRAGDGRVVEYRMRGDRVVRGSARRIIDVPLGGGPTNHNGGQLWYRAGKLWLSVGDGGDGGGASQNRRVLRGKLLRLDVDRGYPYRIPRDNPYARSRSFQREIYAIGLRNPWRFALHPDTGDVLIADVGQDAREEIDRLRVGRDAGANFGWPRFEGSTRRSDAPLARGTRHHGPTAQYSHSSGGCSVTGGVVYRGAAASARGRFLYADLCQRWIAGVRPDGRGRFRVPVGVDGLVSFGYGPRGGVYAASITRGRLYRLVVR